MSIFSLSVNYSYKFDYKAGIHYMIFKIGTYFQMLGIINFVNDYKGKNGHQILNDWGSHTTSIKPIMET